MNIDQRRSLVYITNYSSVCGDCTSLYFKSYCLPGVSVIRAVYCKCLHSGNYAYTEIIRIR